MPICCAAAATRVRRAVNHSPALAGAAPLASPTICCFPGRIRKGPFIIDVRPRRVRPPGEFRAAAAACRVPSVRNDSLRPPARARLRQWRCLSARLLSTYPFRPITPRDQLIMGFHSVTFFARLSGWQWTELHSCSFNRCPPFAISSEHGMSATAYLFT